MGICAECGEDKHSAHKSKYPVTIGGKGLGAKSRTAECECVQCTRHEDATAPLPQDGIERVLRGIENRRDSHARQYPSIWAIRRLHRNPVEAMRLAFPTLTLSDAIGQYDDGRWHAVSPSARARAVEAATHTTVESYDRDGVILYLQREARGTQMEQAWETLAKAIHQSVSG